MSAWTDGPFDEAQKQATLRLLNDLADLVETDPARVAEQTAALLPLLRDRYRDPAYGWALSLRAQACRFLDDLAGVLDATTAGDAAFGEDSQFVAQLLLEAGMSLNQFGQHSDALDHLRRSATAFQGLSNEIGETWALVAIADALAGIGYPEDPMPYLDVAIEKAERHGDDRVRRRAHKQRAVALRHRGQVDEALVSISIALDGQRPGHTRANFQLERGHLLAMAGQYAAADEEFLAAEVVYAERGDTLGLGNCARALATNALILGRNREGLRQLDVAASAYRQLGNDAGLGYVLRERALVRHAEGDDDGADADAAEGVAAFRHCGDRLGLAGMLRTAARVAHVRGQRQAAQELLAEASALVSDGSNPLAEAGILLMRAEIDPDQATRLDAARSAATLYEAMRVSTGRAHALTLAARAQAQAGDSRSALQSLHDARTSWLDARTHVAEPTRRADHDFALRDVVTNALATAAEIGGAAATTFAADLLVMDTPLGLRRSLSTGDIGIRARRIVDRAQTPNVGPRGTPPRRSLLQQLSFALATIEADVSPDLTTFSRFRANHPVAAVLVVGQPTRDSAVPIAWAVPAEPPQFQLSPLSSSQVDSIDALGRALTLDRTDVLWDPSARKWQHELATTLIPDELRAWILAQQPAELVVSIAPVLSHIPFEALLIDEKPLGVIAAIRRVPVVATNPVAPAIESVAAYLDAALPWANERSACPEASSDPSVLRAALGERRLIVVGCHGESATRAEGMLSATDGTPVLDAIDLLAQSLRHSVVVLEACFSGRYVGARTGEQLNLATVALIAGAAEVIAGLFAVPANDATTGRIAGHAIRELRASVPASEALRRARVAYWDRRDPFVALPGMTAPCQTAMPGDAPWAWAGLCAYGR
jgi:tetratricopeptide (TPR) repeat protein